MPTERAIEIANAFIKYAETGDKSIIKQFTREEIETTLLQYHLDKGWAYYIAMEKRIEELKEEENRSKEKIEKWYKTPWKLAIIAIVVAIIFGIPAYVLLFKPPKITIIKSLDGSKTEENLVNRFDETNFSPETELLRKLKPLETDKYLSEMPDNIYGFGFGSAICYELQDKKDFVKLSNIRETSAHFEIQKINNENYLVGFIGDESYANIGKLDKSNKLELMLFPLPWENFKNIVSIPFDSISKIEFRLINTEKNKKIGVLDIKANKIITNVQGHLGKFPFESAR